jgi:hypothetical protein
MVLIIPATRNSILTLLLRLPFDAVIVHHRFFGRFTLFCSVIHFAYYATSYSLEPFVWLTGLGALVCGSVIFFTSLDYIRRHLFNVFYWSHYSFIGFLTLAYFHCSQTKPFILAGGCLYIGDKLLRLIWMLWPYPMTVFKNKGDSIAQVCCTSSPLSDVSHFSRIIACSFVCSTCPLG